MKRTPLERRTPLRSKTGLTRRTRLAPMSKKRRAVQKQRAALVRDQLTQRPWCEAGEIIRAQWTARFGAENAAKLTTDSAWGCSHTATDIHEPLTRARGGSILDAANTVAVCRGCHDWIHDHPAAATELGLLRSQPRRET